MLTFVIPLVSQSISSDWEKTCTLLEGTLRSVLGQSDHEGVRVIVVGHDRPSLPADHRLEFLEVDFAPPSMRSEPTGIRDKFMKLSVGLERVGQVSTTFVMRLDADDRVHRDLTRYVNDRPDTIGWNITTAYNYSPGKPYVHLFDNWVEHAILNSSILEFPQPGHEPPDPRCLFSRWGHQELTAALECKGHSLEALPFPGCVLGQTSRFVVELPPLESGTRFATLTSSHPWQSSKNATVHQIV